MLQPAEKQGNNGVLWQRNAIVSHALIKNKIQSFVSARLQKVTSQNLFHVFII